MSCHELFRQNEICAVPEKAAALINVASSFFLLFSVHKTALR